MFRNIILSHQGHYLCQKSAISIESDQYNILCSRKHNREVHTQSEEEVVCQTGKWSPNAFGRPPAKHPQPHGRVNEENRGYHGKAYQCKILSVVIIFVHR